MTSPPGPDFRAVHGVAITLRKLGRFKESLQYFKKLQSLDDRWGTVAERSSYSDAA